MPSQHKWDLVTKQHFGLLDSLALVSINLNFEIRSKILAAITIHLPLLHLVLQFSGSIDFPSDAQRIEKMKLLVNNGHASQVVLSHDIHTKHRLVGPPDLPCQGAQY